MRHEIPVPDGLLPEFEALFKELYKELFVIQRTMCHSDLLALELAAQAAQNHKIARQKQAEAIAEGDNRAAIAFGTQSQAEGRSCRAALQSLRMVGIDRSTKSKTKLQEAGMQAGLAVGDAWDALLPEPSENN